MLVFFPAAKPTGHRTVRVVAVIVGEDYFEVMTLEVDQTLTLTSSFPTHNFLPGGILSQ